MSVDLFLKMFSLLEMKMQMELHSLAAGEGASFASSACHDQSSSSDEAGAPQLTFPLPFKNFEE